MRTYQPARMVITHGEGVWLYDSEGRRYLDFCAGVAVCCLGHAHPALVETVADQARRVMHVSNYFFNEQNVRLADELCKVTGFDRAFFSNSGAEANEAMLKLVRRWFHQRGRPRTRIIAFEQAFHGRTFGALALTGNPKYLEGYGEPVAGIEHVPYGDLDAVRARMGDDVAAIFVEPVQGEGGVNVPPPVAPALLSATPERADGRRLASASATQEEAEAVLTVLRQLPPSLTPESDPFEVRLAVSAAEGSSAYAIEEQVPEGWSVRQISHDGRWDAVNRKVKWGPFFDGKDRTFTYTAVPAAGITEAAVFAGVGSADGLDHPIGGADRVWPHGYADAPQVTARFTASGPALQVTAAAGRRYRIEISTDLVSWSDWTTVDVGDAGVLEIPMEATGDRAFFRARLAE